jgi:7 transmembrane receptor (rhodopsin family)
MYFCPLLFITGCYLLIVRTVFKRHDELHQKAKMMNVSSIRSGTEQYQMTAEIRTAKVAIMNITMWLISWTPYVMFRLIGTWGNQSGITPLPSMLQSLLSKTSCAYNPVIYCFTHPVFREVSSTLTGHLTFSKTIPVFSESQETPPLDVHCYRCQSKNQRQPISQLHKNWIFRRH